MATADEINALLQGADVPTLKSGGVARVNPLAAITAGNQAAQAEFQTRGLQAQQAIGQIIQQSTDENGNVDWQGAHRMAAGAGPVVQMGMAKFAEDAANRRGQQISQAGALHGFIANLAASGVNDPSPENIAKIRAEGKSYGLPDAGLVEIDRIGAIADPEQRRMEFYKHLQARLDTVKQLATTPYAIPELHDTGGQYRQMGNQAPIPGRPGALTLGGAATKTLTPGEATEIVSVNVPDGPPIQMPKELADRALRSNPRLQELNPGWSYLNPGDAPAPTPRPPVPVPPRGTVPSPSGGRFPSSLNPSGTPPPTAGPRSSLEGGVPVASTDPVMVPQTGAPGALMPGTASNVADIEAGMAQARATPRPPGTQIASDTSPPPSASQQFQPAAARADAVGSPIRTGPTRWGEQPPPGFGEQQTTGAKAASGFEGEAQTARSTTQPLLTAMLPELEAIKNTGAGQKTVSFIQQMAIRSGMVPPKFDPTNPQASMEALGKVFARYQAAQLSALGAQPSDSRQTLAEATSPSMSYSSAGNRKIIHSLMGTNDALDTMYGAWMNSQTRTSNPGNFTAWREAFTAPIQSGPLAGARFDPTVFAVNRMPVADQKQYLNDLRKSSPNDYQQFTKNWALGIHEGWVRPFNAGSASGGGG